MCKSTKKVRITGFYFDFYIRIWHKNLHLFRKCPTLTFYNILTVMCLHRYYTFLKRMGEIFIRFMHDTDLWHVLSHPQRADRAADIK